MHIMFTENDASYEMYKHNNLIKKSLKMNVLLFLFLCALSSFPSDKVSFCFLKSF